MGYLETRLMRWWCSVYEYVGFLDVGKDGGNYGAGDGGEFVDWEDLSGLSGLEKACKKWKGRGGGANIITINHIHHEHEEQGLNISSVISSTRASIALRVDPIHRRVPSEFIARVLTGRERRKMLGYRTIATGGREKSERKVKRPLPRHKEKATMWSTISLWYKVARCAVNEEKRKMSMLYRLHDTKPNALGNPVDNPVAVITINASSVTTRHCSRHICAGYSADPSSGQERPHVWPKS
jgi:hypothetical protein